MERGAVAVEKISDPVGIIRDADAEAVVRIVLDRGKVRIDDVVRGGGKALFDGIEGIVLPEVSDEDNCRIRAGIFYVVNKRNIGRVKIGTSDGVLPELNAHVVESIGEVGVERAERGALVPVRILIGGVVDRHGVDGKACCSGTGLKERGHLVEVVLFDGACAHAHGVRPVGAAGMHRDAVADGKIVDGIRAGLPRSPCRSKDKVGVSRRIKDRDRHGHGACTFIDTCRNDVGRTAGAVGCSRSSHRKDRGLR